MFPTVATTTGSDLVATVSAAFADPGLLTVIALAAGIPLAFYVIARLIGLIPKGRGSRTT